MPLPDPTGWAPQQLLGGLSTSATNSPAPDWTDQATWDRAQQEAQALLANPSGGGQYGQGVWRALAMARNGGDPSSLINAIAAQYTPGGQFGNPEMANGLIKAGIIGTGIGSAFANLGGTAASTGAGGGLSPVTLPPSVAPTGAIPGPLGPSLPAAAGSTAVQTGTGLGAAAGGVGNFLSKYGDYIIPAVNGIAGAYTAGKAADAESAAYQAAIDEQRRQYDTTRTDLMPWLTAGQGALGKLQDPTTNFMASLDYAFRRSEGERDIGNSFAARGGAASGNALRALSEYNSNLASGEFNDWWNRQAGLAGVGQTTGTQLGQLGANTSANVGNYLSGQGASRASGVLGKYGSLAGAGSDIYRNWLYRRAA